MPYKIVNIEAKMKIGVITPPIYGREKNKKLSYGEILKCLAMRAIIDEVMPDGSTVRLNMTNYHYDFIGEWEKTHKKPEVVAPKKEIQDNSSHVTEVKVTELVEEKKEIPTNSVETVEEVPVMPASVEEAENPVVETKIEEPVDTPAVEDKKEEHKSSGFDRDDKSHKNKK